MSVTAAYDLLIVGGGINGAGIARDAAGRGLKVLLVEQGDLASATSSASSKLAHGGLRYLEQFEFRLVREALAEREVLLSIAPHICRPLTFVLPHEPALRPVWMIRLGLLLYDHLAARSRLPGSRAVDLKRDLPGNPLKASFSRGFTYADCSIDDSRLVVLNAVDAGEHGAEIRTRCRFVDARPEAGLWVARLEQADATPRSATARIIVNAAGPWADSVLQVISGSAGRGRRLRLVKGSHIVVPRLHTGNEAYVLQNPDGRVVFLLPLEDRFTLIGTTEVDFEGKPDAVSIDAEETKYLCTAASRFLSRPIQESEVVWSYAGVRPLLDDNESTPSKVTRDYVLELQHGNDRPPVLSVLGGKLTTYRSVAEQVIDKLGRFWPRLKRAWTADSPLPGGDIPQGDVDRYSARLAAARPWLPQSTARRLCRSYGTRAERIVGPARMWSDLGREFGNGLTERELEYLVGVEFANTAEDILWRRSKLGLHVGAEANEQISRWLAKSR
jgi:glycerol-3-phosphate dehydrogenase